MKRFLFLLLALALFLPAQAWGACAFVNAGTAGTAESGDVTLGAPATPATNDVWIALVGSGDNVAHTFTDWTEIVNANGSEANIRYSAWYHRYAGSAPNLIVGHTTGAPILGRIAAFRGCKATGSPIDTIGTPDAQDNDDTPTIPGITPSVSNTLLVAMWVYNEDNTVSSGPSGFSAGFNSEFNATAVPDMGVHLYYKDHTSGPTGDFAVTMNAMGTNDEYAAVLIAIAPATAAAGGTNGMLMGVGK